MSVTTWATTITVACQLMVRQTCVCFARPIGPVDLFLGIPFHQSKNPVITARRPTAYPATITKVAATKKSRAFGSDDAEKYEIRSNTAASA